MHSSEQKSQEISQEHKPPQNLQTPQSQQNILANEQQQAVPPVSTPAMESAPIQQHMLPPQQHGLPQGQPIHHHPGKKNN